MRAAVYLGSHCGNSPVYCESAFELGRKLALKGIGVIYGGTNVGTMGALYRGVASAGGECIGIFPEGFKGRPALVHEGAQIMQEGLTQMISAKDFPERKRMMEDMSDCCIALPGSWGTMDELFAYATSTQLQMNGGKRVFVLNTCGYYDDLKAQLSKMDREGFIDADARNLIRFCDTLDELISLI